MLGLLKPFGFKMHMRFYVSDLASLCSDHNASFSLQQLKTVGMEAGILHSVCSLSPAPRVATVTLIQLLCCISGILVRMAMTFSCKSFQDCCLAMTKGPSDY